MYYLNLQKEETKGSKSYPVRRRFVEAVFLKIINGLLWALFPPK